MRFRWIAEDRFQYEPPWLVVLWDLAVLGVIGSIALVLIEAIL
jgi:hypothetical protein